MEHEDQVCHQLERHILGQLPLVGPAVGRLEQRAVSLVLEPRLEFPFKLEVIEKLEKHHPGEHGQAVCIAAQTLVFSHDVAHALDDAGQALGGALLEGQLFSSGCGDGSLGSDVRARLEINVGTVSYKLAQSNIELLEVGEQMGHCVGGYARDVFDGRSLIVVARNRQHKPVACIELSGDGKQLRQYKLLHNHRSRGEELERANEWCRQVKVNANCPDLLEA